jgi:hypothetical protein
VAWWLFDVPELYGNAVVDGYILLGATPFLWTAAAGLYGLRAPVPGPPVRAFLDDLAGVAGLMTLGAWGVILSSYATGKPDPDIPQLFAFWALGVAAVTLARQPVRALHRGQPSPPAGWLRLRWRPGRPLRALVLADVAAVFAVCMAGWPLLQEPKPADSTAWAWVLLLGGLVVWVGIGAACGLYAQPRSLRDDVAAAVHLASAGAWLVIVLSPVGGEINPDIPQVFGVWALAVAGVVAARELARRAAATATSSRSGRCSRFAPAGWGRQRSTRPPPAARRGSDRSRR